MPIRTTVPVHQHYCLCLSARLPLPTRNRLLIGRKSGLAILWQICCWRENKKRDFWLLTLMRVMPICITAPAHQYYCPCPSASLPLVTCNWLLVGRISGLIKLKQFLILLLTEKRTKLKFFPHQFFFPSASIFGFLISARYLWLLTTNQALSSSLTSIFWWKTRPDTRPKPVTDGWAGARMRVFSLCDHSSVTD